LAFLDSLEDHLPLLLRLAARLAPRKIPQDVVQDALERAWKYRDSFDPSRGAYVDWLLAIVANEARRYRRTLLTGVGVESPAFDAHSDERLDVERALRKLSSRQRLAVDCHYYAGLSIAQTARVMRCSEGTVKSTLADARAKLRNALEVT
jgi:RNA polymerase sigma factor (sigma-70 family)